MDDYFFNNVNNGLISDYDDYLNVGNVYMYLIPINMANMLTQYVVDARS